MNIKNKKVLVTGAGGFIGSHLTEALVKKGANVRAFIRYNSRNFWGWLENSEVKDDIEVILGDIRDYDSVKDAVKSNKVLHRPQKSHSIYELKEHHKDKLRRLYNKIN